MNIEKERYEIAEILANNFTPEKYDASDFEWCAYQLQMNGYHRERDTVIDILTEFDIIMATTPWDRRTIVIAQKIAELKEKYKEKNYEKEEQI